MITEQKNRTSGINGNFVICDYQKEYSESLFRILVRKYPERYQFHIFHDPEKLKVFSQTAEIHVLLISQEYEEQIEEIKAAKIYVLSESEKICVRDSIYVFRYQPAGKIMEKILFRQVNPEKKERPRIRDETVINGILGVYSPVHRIGKTKFALRLGSQIAAKGNALYLNLEGYSGGSYYFPDNNGYDMGDLLYCIRQDSMNQGIKISMMTGQINGMDYILPMKNEIDFRSVRAEEWISLLNIINEKCIYDCIILDLGDSIRGLYEILRQCRRIYTPYIEEEAALAKMEQYEKNLREAGYTDILSRTVKRKIRKAGIKIQTDGSSGMRDRISGNGNGGVYEADRTAL